MTAVTIVTAFFDIGRESFKARPRSTDTYFEHFRFWARMRNPLVVYAQPEWCQRIMDIREEFGRGEVTTVIEVEDLLAIEPAIHRSMMEIAADPYFQAFRLMPEATSGIADYSYLMLLKTWFVADAVQRGLTEEVVVWLDFGFNQGGLIYPEPREFDFEWISDGIERVVLFTMAEYDRRPIFELVRQLSDCIMGAPMLIPARRAEELWRVNREAMAILNRVGLLDDDQLIQMLSYRIRPDLFELRRSNWLLPVKEVAAPHLTVSLPAKRPWPARIARAGVHLYRRHRRAVSSAWRLYRISSRGRA